MQVQSFVLVFFPRGNCCICLFVHQNLTLQYKEYMSYMQEISKKSTAPWRNKCVPDTASLTRGRGTQVGRGWEGQEFPRGNRKGIKKPPTR